MKIGEIINSKFTISFEFSPPKTDEAEAELFNQLKSLKEKKPDFVSVTYGAGGSTRDKTQSIVRKMRSEENLKVIAHQTCINHTKSEVIAILDSYKQSGIDAILALRGDTPVGTNIRPEDGELPHSIELVRLIKEHYGDYFSIGTAAFPERHPESPNMDWEMKFFKEKVDAGVDFATSQLFFVNMFFYDMLDAMLKQNITIPVLPGIWPITNFKQIKRVAELSHAIIPPELVKKMEKYEDNNEEISKIGIEFAIKQCEDLIQNGVRGLHFYTLNKSLATTQIFDAIKNSI